MGCSVWERSKEVSEKHEKWVEVLEGKLPRNSRRKMVIITLNFCYRSTRVMQTDNY